MMKEKWKNTRQILGLLVILLISGLIQLHAQPEPTNSCKIDQLWEKFIDYWHSEDIEGLMSMYADDAINIPPGSAIKKGKEEIAELYQFLFDNHTSSTYRHETLQLVPSLTTSTEVGKFEVAWVRNDGTAWTFKARCMALWETVDTGCKLKYFVFNTPPEE